MEKNEDKKRKKENFLKSKEAKKLEESYKLGIKYYEEVDEQKQ